MKAFSTITTSLVALTLLAGCTKTATPAVNNSATTPSTPTVTETPGATSTSPTIVGTGEGVNLTVTLSEYEIAPKIIEVIAGAENVLTVKNQGSVVHTFSVPTLDLDVEIPAGGSEVVVVNGAGAGTYDVICKIGGHEALGMKAQIIAQ